MTTGRSVHPRRTVPIAYTGLLCARRGCSRPDWKDGLCSRCWRLAALFGKEPRLFAYEPLNGYADARDAVARPWDRPERASSSAAADLPDRGRHLRVEREQPLERRA